MKHVKSLTATIAIAMCSMAAQASVVYTFDSSDYTNAAAPYTKSMNLSFQFSLDNALGQGETLDVDKLPGFEFLSASDGVNKLKDPATTFLQTLDLTINALGQVSEDNFSFGFAAFEASGNHAPGSGYAQVVDFSTRTTAFTGDGVTWTVQASASPVPEPSSFTLMGIALAGWGAMALRSRKQRSQS